MMPPGTTWTHPTGGFYVWTTLPEGLDAKVMQPRAITARVAYVPGIGFYAEEMMFDADCHTKLVAIGFREGECNDCGGCSASDVSLFAPLALLLRRRR